MKIYLSGPMRNYPESNYPEFNRVAEVLRDQKHMVYNPAEWVNPCGTGFDIKAAFKDYCNWICCEAEAIYLLDGWGAS